MSLLVEAYTKLPQPRAGDDPDLFVAGIEAGLGEFLAEVRAKYTEGTLQRLLASPVTDARRAAALAVGLVGGMKSNPALAAAHRPAHRAYLTSLLEAGKLVCAGPFTDDTGALIVYEAESAAAAEDLIRGDPFHAAGVFSRWTLKPWKAVFAAPQLLPPNG